MNILTIETAKAYVTAKLVQWNQESEIVGVRWQNALLNDVVEIDTADGLRWDVWVEGDALYGEC